MESTLAAETMESRVRRLERENRFVRAGLVLALLLLAALVCVSASTPATVVAREFVLRDGAGKTRARLGMTNGGPRLGLIDANGRMRARLLLDKAGDPYVSLRDATLGDRVMIGYNLYTGPYVAVWTSLGPGSAIMCTDTQDFYGLLFVQDDYGNILWAAP